MVRTRKIRTKKNERIVDLDVFIREQKGLGKSEKEIAAELKLPLSQVQDILSKGAK